MSREPYSPAEIDAVMNHYENTPTAELAERIGSLVGRLNRVAHLLEIRKSKECIAAMSRERSLRPDHGGRAFQFKKGIVPHNKGKKMPGFAAGRMGETQFKKGQRSGKAAQNWMPIGARRQIEGWWWVKVSDIPNVPYTVNWKAEHVMLWEKKRGPVPAGHVVCFKDGNKDHTKISNLELVSRQDMMRRNTVHNLPEPVKELIRLNGAIRRVITCRKRKHAEKQDVRPAQSPVRDAGSVEGRRQANGNSSRARG